MLLRELELEICPNGEKVTVHPMCVNSHSRIDAGIVHSQA